MANLRHTTSARQFEEVGSQGTPDAGLWELYFDSAGGHIKDDAGEITDLGRPNQTAETSFWAGAAALRPSDTDGPTPAGADGTNASVDYLVFDGVTAQDAFLSWSPPPQWDAGTIEVEFVWGIATGGTAGQYVKFEAQAVAIGDDEIQDTALGTAVTIEDPITAVGDEQRCKTAAITIGNTPTIDKTIHIRVARSFTSVTPTASATDLHLYGVRVHYTNTALSGQIVATVDGGGTVISTGDLDTHISASCSGVITEAILLADQSGSIVIDVWKDVFANFPPTDADSITASAPPTLSSAQSSSDSTLTGWTLNFSEGDVFGFSVDSVTDIERATLILKYNKT